MTRCGVRGPFAVARHFGEVERALQVLRHVAAEHEDAVVVEVFEGPRRTVTLEIFRRSVDVEVHRKQLALDQVGLRRLAQTDGDVGLAHGEIEFLFRGQQRDVDFRIKLGELAKAGREPMHAEAWRRRHPQVAVRPFPAVGQLGARRFELHEHVMGGAEQQVALLGQDQSARMAVKQRDRELLLQRAHLTRHRRLGEPELFAGMGEAARFGCGMKYFELIPIHCCAF